MITAFGVAALIWAFIAVRRYQGIAQRAQHGTG
jgi:hypothetical protein